MITVNTPTLRRTGKSINVFKGTVKEKTERLPLKKKRVRGVLWDICKQQLVRT